MGATSVVFTKFHAYRVGNTLDRKLASGDPNSGKLQLCTRTMDSTCIAAQYQPLFVCLSK
eukprot:5092969-Prymnesium_polylepis.1